MKRPVLLCCVCWAFLLATPVSGDVSPHIVLHNGENIVSFTIANLTRQAVQSLTVAAVEETLPKWIKVSTTSFSFLSEKEEIEIQLPVTVAGASEKTRGELTLLLSDKKDRHWQTTVYIEVNSSVIKEDLLLPNVPNPFNPETTIQYQLSGTEARSTSLIVYNTLGQKVRVLAEGMQQPGVYSIRWDGKDDLGRFVASGIYIYRLSSGAFLQSRQMVLLK